MIPLTIKDVVTTSKIIESHFRCSNYTRSGILLRQDQRKIWSDAMILLTLAWLDLIPSELTPSLRWLQPWMRAISSTDVIDVVRTVKLSNDWLISTYSSFWNYDTFKGYLRQEGGKANLISPTKSLIDRWALYRDPDDLRRLRTAFSFITRISLPDLQDLKEQAAARYVAVDADLQTEFTQEEIDIIRHWFPYETLGSLCELWDPKHGPGSTADSGNVKIAKYRHMGTDDMIRRLDLLLGGNTTFNTHIIRRTSKVVFVPKTVDKLRTICQEPAVLQWYQQGFFRSIQKYIVNHEYLSRRIDLEDQSMSQELAYQGSIDGKLSTIDLSDASDRVSWSLVKSWMRNSSLLPICWLTRSRRAEVEGIGEMVQRKYAPMGSALCFPIECIVFCAIVEASIKSEGGSVHDSCYRVYGDDIIVETRYANAVIDRLTRNGFVVNNAKSFYRIETHNFRESCGGEFFDGVDVTPLRLPRKFKGLTGGRVVPSSIVALVDLCNTFYVLLPSVRKYIIRDLLKLPKDVRPVFDTDGELGIFSPFPTNYHLQEPTYHEKHQQWYFIHGGSCLGDSSKHEDESYALYEQLRSTKARRSLSSPEDRISPTMGPKPVLQWSLTKTPVEKVVSQTTLSGILEREK